MAKWEIKDFSLGEYPSFGLLRDGKQVGEIEGIIRRVSFLGPRYIFINWFGIDKKYQQEYVEAHGASMGEALGWKLLDLLKKKGVAYIAPSTNIAPDAGRFIARYAQAGILSSGHPHRLLKINWKNVPSTELGGKETGARAAKIKRGREWASKLFRRRPK